MRGKDHIKRQKEGSADPVEEAEQDPAGQGEGLPDREGQDEEGVWSSGGKGVKRIQEVVPGETHRTKGV